MIIENFAAERIADSGDSRIEAARYALELAEHCFSRNWVAHALQHDLKALQLGIDSDRGAFRRWACCMMLGDFESAWRETDRSEARRRARGETSADLPLHERRVWNGSPLANRRVLVRCYHGLGDTIHFARFLAQLGSVAESVTVQAQTALIPLLSSMAASGSFFALVDNEGDLPKWDVDIELMELPYAFRTTLGALPVSVPYMHVPLDAMEDARRQLVASGLNDECISVGLVWSTGGWNQTRNMPAERLACLTEIPGVRLFSLQRGAAEMQELQSIETCRNITAVERESGTPLDTAAAILNLDLVISVDTMVAHLAGALAKPVWTLLPFCADWRWMVDREDSPWYPTMRLFRQPKPGAWEIVAERISGELARAAKQRRGRSTKGAHAG